MVISLHHSDGCRQLGLDAELLGHLPKTNADSGPVAPVIAND